MIAIDCRGRDALAPAESEAVSTAVRSGGVVLFPTDTLYALGADPLSLAAVEKVFRLKRRAALKPLLLLIEDPRLVPRFAAAVPGPWEALMARFWPGPLTLIFPARPDLPAGLAAASGTVALRVPGSALCRAVLRAAGGCLTGTSANRSGQDAPRDPEAVLRALGAGIDVVVDAGTLPPSRESTLLEIDGSGRARAVREGAVAARAWQRVLTSP